MLDFTVTIPWGLSEAVRRLEALSEIWQVHGVMFPQGFAAQTAGNLQ
jgi:hypothetical protein